MQKLVSVVIPVYNSEKKLKHTIESVINQTYSNIEIILINDGSQDSSLEICNSYKEQDKRIIVINKENSGVSNTRNKGIEIASGKYIMFIDSDDYIEKEMIYDMINKTDENTDLVISGMKMQYIENGKIVSQEKYCLMNKTYSVDDFVNAMMRDFELICFCGPCCKLYKTENLKKFNVKFPTNLTMGEDTWYNLDYISVCSGKIVTLSKIYYNYIRENKNSLFTRFYEDYIKITEKVYNKFLTFLRDRANEQTVKMYEKNYVINLVYANSINFKYKTSFKKRFSDLKYSLNNIEVRKNIKNMKTCNNKEKIFIFMIKYKLTFCIYLYFWTKNLRRRK